MKQRCYKKRRQHYSAGCVVYRPNNNANGNPFKCFTLSVGMRSILEQNREVPDGFPFETTIKAETFGKGKTKYIFT